MIELPQLPYEKNGLSPYITQETLAYHYGKHHQTYVNKLNALIKDTPLESLALEDIILRSSGAIFNNAAQVWNHTFYWESLSDQHNQTPKGSLLLAINKYFGSLDAFIEQFSEQAAGVFGSGWCWLVLNPDDFSLSIQTTANADLPMTQNLHALLTCDVWEHAYYLDTQNQRPKYIENFWKVVNWSQVEKRYQTYTGTQDE